MGASVPRARPLQLRSCRLPLTNTAPRKAARRAGDRLERVGDVDLLRPVAVLERARAHRAGLGADQAKEVVGPQVQAAGRARGGSAPPPGPSSSMPPRTNSRGMAGGRDRGEGGQGVGHRGGIGVVAVEVEEPAAPPGAVRPAAAPAASAASRCPDRLRADAEVAGRRRSRAPRSAPCRRRPGGSEKIAGGRPPTNGRPSSLAAGRRKNDPIRCTAAGPRSAAASTDDQSAPAAPGRRRSPRRMPGKMRHAAGPHRRGQQGLLPRDARPGRPARPDGPVPPG